MKTSIYLNDETLESINSRCGKDGSRSETIARLIARLEDILKRHRPKLSDAEWALLSEALGGIVFEPTSIRYVWARVEDAISENALGDKHGVDGRALVEKLRSLDHAGLVAIVDEAERHWMGSKPPTGEAIKLPPPALSMVTATKENPAMATRVHEVALVGGINRSEEFERKGLAKYAINCGLKCDHDCLYCSTASFLGRNALFSATGEKVDGVGYAIIDPNLPDIVAQKARSMRARGLIQLSTTVDAWSPEAQKHQIGRRCLEAVLSQPDWTIRILTKNAAVAKDFDVVEKYRDRVIVGLSLTTVPSRNAMAAAIELKASLVSERVAALQEAHRRGLRTYAMLCPLPPGIGDDEACIRELVDLAIGFGAEEFFAEPLNVRVGFDNAVNALRDAGFTREADAVADIKDGGIWSGYTRKLIETIQSALRRRRRLKDLRFLLYPERLTRQDATWIKKHGEGVVWLT